MHGMVLLNEKKERARGVEKNTWSLKHINAVKERKRKYASCYCFMRTQILHLKPDDANVAEDYPEHTEADTFTKNAALSHNLGDGKSVDSWIWCFGWLKGLSDAEKSDFIVKCEYWTITLIIQNSFVYSPLNSRMCTMALGTRGYGIVGWGGWSPWGRNALPQTIMRENREHLDSTCLFNINQPSICQSQNLYKWGYPSLGWSLCVCFSKGFNVQDNGSRCPLLVYRHMGQLPNYIIYGPKINLDVMWYTGSLVTSENPWCSCVTRSTWRAFDI